MPHAAHLCPADDGGYVLLGLPRELFTPPTRDAARASLFEGVRWSSSDTCSSQAQALARAGLRAAMVGPTYHPNPNPSPKPNPNPNPSPKTSPNPNPNQGPTYPDCDEIEDVIGLEVRLRAAAAPSRCVNVGAWLDRLREVLN